MDLKTTIDSLPSLRVTVDAHGLLAKKSLGQTTPSILRQPSKQ